MVGPPANLLGSQRATTRRVPRGRADPDVVDLARRLGMGLEPWQEDILGGACRTTGPRWSAFEVAAIVPRQNGKSYLVPARAVAGALLFGERLIIYSAHEYRTAQETWRLMRDLCESDWLAPYVKRVRVMAGGEVVEFTNGARFKMMARTRTSGRGFSPDCLLLDEAFALSADVIAAVLPSMAARPNPQVWYLSSAGTYDSETLLGVRRRGHAGSDPGLAYWEWHASTTDDPSDPRVHAAANPAYGGRLKAEAVAREYHTMTRSAFLRERLGVWSRTVVESMWDDATIGPLVVDPGPPPADGRPIGWGVDAAWDRSGAAIAAAHYGDDGVPVLTLVAARPGAGWVPAELADLGDRYELDAVAYDHRGGLVDLMDHAERDHGIRPAPMRYADYPAACADLAQRVTDGSVRFARAPMLVSDATHASALSLPSGWVWSRKVTTPPTHLIAATAALWALERVNGGSAVAVY